MDIRVKFAAVQQRRLSTDVGVNAKERSSIYWPTEKRGQVVHGDLGESRKGRESDSSRNASRGDGRLE
jgi:hypothetical protein